jgi:ComEC/Rec2-related protein
VAVGEARRVGDERSLFAGAKLDDGAGFPAVPASTALLDATAPTGAIEHRKTLAAGQPAIRLWTGGSAGLIQSVLARMRAAALADWERGVGFLLVPVCLCVGALIYFSLNEEPAAYELIAILAALSFGLLLARERILARCLISGLIFVSLGMAAAKFETWRAGTKVIGGEISTRVTGRVVQIEHQASGRVRLTIDVIETARPTLRYAPDRIRATARDIPDTIVTGGGVSGLVRLRPPSGPVRPGSYDFAFNSYFDGIGANGFFLTAPEPASLVEPASSPVRLTTWIENVRSGLAERIRRSIEGPEGEIAAALIAGVTAGIPEEANEAMRISGIYHVISISGLHLALVALTVMGTMRGAFALFPAFASRHPVKKYAAAIALLVVFFYLFLSGAEVATQRSFIMLAVMLVALIFDRAALTMRNLAVAAIVVIAIAPHEVAGPSFQMSFAATAALIAAYAAWSERRLRSPGHAERHDRSRAMKVARFLALYGGGIAVTSIVAGLATALFGAWHFNRVAPLGLIANLAAMPVVSLLVMPWALAAVVLMPFGLDGVPLWVMGEGITIMLRIADWVAARSPLDEVGIVPVSAVLLFSSALVVLTLSTSFLRIAAMPLLIAGVLVLAGREAPDVMIAEDARLIAIPQPDGRLAVNRARPNAFTVENWARALAAAGLAKPATVDKIVQAAAGSSLPVSGFSCNEALCFARHESGALVAHAADAKAALPACGVASLVVIDDATAGKVCASKSTVISKRDLARGGSAEVRFRNSAADIRAEVSYAVTEPFRPWHSHRAFSREARGMPAYQRPERKDLSDAEAVSADASGIGPQHLPK